MRSLKGALLALLVVASAAMAKDAPLISGSGAPVRAVLPPGTLRPDPAAARAVAALPDTWNNLFTDDFEGAFPGSWQIVNQGQIDAGWATWTCWSGDTPSHSIGCAAGGAAAISCGEDYPAFMDAWIFRGPYNLSDAAYIAAELQFNVRVDSEQGFDYVAAMASIDGQNWGGVSLTGTVAPQLFTFDLTEVPDLGNLLGQSQVWVAFWFHSDELLAAPNGAQIDDVVLRVATATANQAPLVTVNAPNGGESWPAGASRNITWTATDADGGPDPLSVAIDWSNNSGGAWQAVTTGLTNTGTYAWTVPAGATTTARVRVRASDGEAEGQDTSNADFTITEVQPGDNTLSVGSGAGASGTSISLPVSLSNENTVKGVQFDLIYDDDVAVFSGATATGRGAGMTVASHVVSDGRARVVMYHDDNAVVVVGSGEIASLVFEVTGQPAQDTAVMPVDIILSDADGLPLDVEGEQGTITVQAATQVPALQIAVLKNPGRPHTLQILVNVTRGSGNPPTVTAGSTAVTMSALGGSRFIGTFAAAHDAASVIISASDTNTQGPGSSQTTVNF